MDKRIKLVTAALVSAIGMMGCAQRPDTEETTNNEIQTATGMEQLEDGAFYVYNGETYEKPYSLGANFQISSDSGWSESNILWYKDDWNKVPTLYKGDKLVYKTTSDLNENFYFVRYKYLGYTVGLSRLSTTPSGRYSFTVGDNGSNIYSASDAAALYNLPTSYAIIDTIGGVPLKDENVSPGGCIINLEKDKVYKAEIYAGTILYATNLTADNLALSGMDSCHTIDYTFMQSDIIEIHIPEYFNSGYYMINGSGLFRYVNGSEYDDDTDFNIPNIDPDKEKESETDENGNPKETKEPETDENGETIVSTEPTTSIEITTPGNYTLIVSLQTTGLIRSQQVYLKSETEEIMLTREGIKFYTTRHLDAGTYEIYATNTDAKINYSLEMNNADEIGTTEYEQENYEPEGPTED